VLAYRQSALLEPLGEGRGVLVEDQAAFLATLEGLRQDEARRRAVGQAALAWTASHVPSWEQGVKGLLAAMGLERAGEVGDAGRTDS